MNIKSSPFFNWSALISLAMIWGSSFILMKRGLESFTPNQVAALRMFIAFLFLAPLIVRHFKKKYLPYSKYFIAIGLFGNFIPAFLFTHAETGINSSLAGMLNALTPVFTVIIGVLFFQSKTRWINIAGIILGLIGAVGLMYNEQSAGASLHIEYSLLVVIATLCYGLSVNIVKRHLNHISAITSTVMSFIFVGPPAGIYLFLTDFPTRMQQDPNALHNLGYVSILGILGTAVSVILYYVLVRKTTPVLASSVTYLIPIVAMMWGIADGESLNAWHFMWIGVILSGIYLVNRRNSALKKAT